MRAKDEELDAAFKELAELLNDIKLPDDVKRSYVISAENNYRAKDDILGDNPTASLLREMLTFDTNIITYEEYIRFGRTMVFIDLYNKE